MSASREKKQRQGGTPSDKAATAKQQAEETRRKTIQYTVIGVVVTVLVVALLIWNSGFFQARATAVKVGSTNYTTAQASYFYRSTYDYYIAVNYAQFMGYDTSKSPASQEFGEDGKTFHDHFMEAALEQMTTITALYDAAKADGFSDSNVADQVKATVESAKQSAASNSVSYKQYLKGVYGSYMTPSVFEDCVTRERVAYQYLQDHPDTLTYTNDQLQAYYSEHSDELDNFQYSYLYYAPADVETKDADGNDIEMTDEEKTAAEEQNQAEAKAKAEDARKALEGGKSVDDVISENSPTSYGKDEDTDGSSLNSAFSEWLTDSARKAGDVTMEENTSTNGYYVVVFHGRYLDESPTANTRHILITAETSDGASSPTDEQMAAAKVKAEELLSQWQTGAATEESFAELANANSADTGSNTKGGLYENVYEGQFVANYNEWLFDSARKPGDTGVVENRGSYYGYHVVYYVKQNPDFTTWMAKAENTMASEDTQSWQEDLEANCKAEAASGAKYLGK